MSATSTGERADASMAELVADYRAISDELARRGIGQRLPDMVERFGEWLLVRCLEADGRDVRRSARRGRWTAGTRQITIVTVVAPVPSRSPAVTLRRLDFDDLGVVVLGDQLRPTAALLIPKDRVEALAKHHETGWTLRITPAVAVDRAVVDLTARARELAV